MNLPDKLTGSLLSLKLTGNGSILAPDVNFSIVKASILTGKGYIDISGSCREADLSVTGVGEIRAHKLEARDVRCSIYGNASIGCFAEKTLKAKATGNGTVYYEGTQHKKLHRKYKKYYLCPEKTKPKKKILCKKKLTNS